VRRRPARGKLEQSVNECDNPVQQHYRMGVNFGVRGTPSIYTRDGRKLGGYVPPQQLAAALGLGDADTGN